jgi:uncharacterized phosphosugar-binding protein
MDLLAQRKAVDIDALASAAVICADAVAEGSLVHLFGVGHSALPVLELFPRYGSFIGMNPIVDPRLLWFGVSAPGGVPGMRYLEDVKGYAAVLLRSVPINRGDVFVIFSHGLRSTLTREAIAYATSKGCRTIAISSSAASGRTSGLSSSAEAIVGAPELVLDTGVPVGDTLVYVDGALGGFGAGSSVISTILGLALVSATGEQLVARGFRLEQSRRTGAGLNEQDWAFYEAFEKSVREAWAKADSSDHRLL